MEKESAKELDKIAEKENVPKKKLEKETIWIVGIMIGLVVLFAVSFYFFESLKNFEYEGLSFTKEKFGDIPLYHYYYFTDLGAITGSAVDVGKSKKIEVYLRNDPRENNVSYEGSDVEFYRRRFVYIGLNGTGLLECPYSTIAVASLSGFLAQNGFATRAGTVLEEEANNETQLKYVTCEKYPEHPVIILQAGDETKIVRENNCYTITAANCEILEAVEKFEVRALVDAKKRAGL